jgi:hypothetical protein
MRPRTNACALCLAAALAGALTVAAPRARAADDDVAMAQILFLEGRRLVAKHDYEGACPKFAESQRLSPGIGTEFNLADCWEHIGKLASAWGAFLDVVELTHRRGEVDREQAARARADALEGKLGRLSIEVPVARRVAGLELRRDGEIVREALWGVAVPVDPGEHQVEGRAPGYHAFTATVHTINGQTTSVALTELAPMPAPAGVAGAPEPAGTAVPHPGASVRSVPVNEAPGATEGVAGSANGHASGGAEAPDRTVPLVILGGALVLAGAGVVGLLEYDSNVANYNADPACGMGLPATARCDDLVSTANTWRAAAVVSFVASGVAAASGVALWILAPPPKGAVRAWPAVACSAGVGSIACGGRF